MEEVEQVRQALGLIPAILSSWKFLGGILAMEYALKYQDHLKGNGGLHMTADFDRYEAYKCRAGSETPDRVCWTPSNIK